MKSKKETNVTVEVSKDVKGERLDTIWAIIEYLVVVIFAIVALVNVEMSKVNVTTDTDLYIKLQLAASSLCIVNGWSIGAILTRIFDVVKYNKILKAANNIPDATTDKDANE